MPPTFCPDWRCASTGMSDLDADRIGIPTQTQQGVWGDWAARSDEHPASSDNQDEQPSYRIVVNQDTNQIVGATLYGPGATDRIALLRFAIDEGLTVADLHLMVCESWRGRSAWQRRLVPRPR